MTIENPAAAQGTELTLADQHQHQHTAAAIAERKAYANDLAANDLLPAAFKGKAENIFYAIELADALGIERINAFTEIHMVQGRPTISANLMGSLVRRAGHRLRITTDPTGARVKAEIVRWDDPEHTFVTVWDMPRANAAGITGKDTWKKFPLQMLKARAIAECTREACAEVLMGTYAPEEFGVDIVNGGPQSPRRGVGGGGLAMLRAKQHTQPDAPTQQPDPTVYEGEFVDYED